MVEYLSFFMSESGQKKGTVVVSGDSKKKIRTYLVKIFVQWVLILSEELF